MNVWTVKPVFGGSFLSFEILHATERLLSVDLGQLSCVKKGRLQVHEDSPRSAAKLQWRFEIISIVDEGRGGRNWRGTDAKQHLRGNTYISYGCQ